MPCRIEIELIMPEFELIWFFVCANQ